MEQANSRARRRLGPELQELAEGLDKDLFRALSPGIGIGNLRPKVASGPARKIEARRVSVIPPVGDVSEQAAQGLDAPRPLTPPQGPGRTDQCPVKKPRMPWTKRLLALGIDFLLVATTVCTALLVAAIFSAAKSGGEVHWTSLAPVRWVTAFSPLAILAGVYGTFAAYWLLFRVLAGGTLGESAIMRITRKAPKAAQQSLGTQAFRSGR